MEAITPANNVFTTNQPPMWISLTASFLALGGLIDSVYLTAEHLSGKIAPCSVVKGCETVLTSSYAEIYGIPTATFGAIAYFTVFSLAILTTFSYPKTWTMLSIVSLIMTLFTFWLLYLQAFVIQAFCQYCLLSAFFTFSIFVMVIWSRFLKSGKS